MKFHNLPLTHSIICIILNCTISNLSILTKFYLFREKKKREKYNIPKNVFLLASKLVSTDKNLLGAKANSDN